MKVLCSQSVAPKIGKSLGVCHLADLGSHHIIKKTSDLLLDQSYKENLKQVLNVFNDLRAICMSVDWLSNINSKTLFDVMGGGPLAFVTHTFRLE